MATDNSTATTPEELAERFPCTVRPFAVWYNSDPKADELRWCVNNESGEPTQEFEDMATALKTAAEMGREWDAEARNQADAHAKVTGQDNTETPDFMNQFYDLRALAMNARSLTYTVSESMEGDSDELNAVRRVLSMLEEKALQFADEADAFLLHARNQESEAHHA